MNEKFKERPGYNEYDYLQAQFREQARRSIFNTKRKLDSKQPDSFAIMMRQAHERALLAMKHIGIYDVNGKIIKGTKKEAELIFDVYYNAYLRHKVNANQNDTSVIGEVLKRIGT